MSLFQNTWGSVWLCCIDRIHKKAVQSKANCPLDLMYGLHGDHSDGFCSWEVTMWVGLGVLSEFEKVHMWSHEPPVNRMAYI